MGSIAVLDWINRHPSSKMIRILGDKLNPKRAEILNKVIPLTHQTMPGLLGQVLEDQACDLAVIIADAKAGNPSSNQDYGLHNIRPAMRLLEAGSQIFEMEENLIEELNATDVDDVTVDELHLPYNAFYLRFQNGLGEGGMIDGFVIEKRVAQENIIYFQPFSADGLILNGGYIPISTDTIPQAIEKMVAKYQGSGDSSIMEIVTNHELTDEKETALREDSKEHTARMRQGYVVLGEYLNLLINSILYIDHCRSPNQQQWPADAPRHLVDKAQGDKPGARKAAQALRASGWTKVHLCKIEEMATESENDNVTNITSGRRGHWRRGHWKRQRHGPGYSLVKRIRIRPTLVRASAGHGQTEGRTYNVTSNQSTF